MRIDACLRSGIAVCGLVLGYAPASDAACDNLWPAAPDPPWIYPGYEVNWFVGSLESTDDFGNRFRWVRFPHGHGPGGVGDPCDIWVLPIPGEHAYLTFGYKAEVSTTDDLHMGQLYVGGWPIEFDPGLGGHPERPVGEFGEPGYDPRDAGFLDIPGGSLKVHGCGCVVNPELPGAPPGSPPCLGGNVVECYERVGYRGTYGEIVQTGGEHHSANTVSLGLGSSCIDPEDPEGFCSHGVYRLEGGTFKPRGVGCGAQGLGEFHMSEDGEEETIYNGGGGFTVGAAYAYHGALDNPVPVPSDPDLLPKIAGHCEFTQSGGVFTQAHSFRVGSGWDDSVTEPVHATGVARISGDASFSATSLWVGGGDDEFVLETETVPAHFERLPGGVGEFIQEGGNVNADFFIVIGVNEESSGTYTIRGGALTQTGVGANPAQGSLTVPDRGMYVGFDGHGELIVEGGASTIDIAGVYHQGSDSLLTFKMSNVTGPQITPIEVAGTATFEPGAKLKLEGLDGYVPGSNEHFPVFIANQVVGESNLTLDDPSSGQWALNWTGTSPRTLVVTKINPCGLLGIEPVILVLALRATRRWRRS